MPDDFDIIIRDTQVLDGTGAPPYRGSIAVMGDRIAAVGDFPGAAKLEIAGESFITCPGFIDIHNHADMSILSYPLAENLVMQGITTFVGGNCGASMAPMDTYIPWGRFTESMVGSWWHDVAPHHGKPPRLVSLREHGAIMERHMGFAFDWRTFDEFLTKVSNLGIAVNYAPLVGHHSIRLGVLGDHFQRRATEAELQGMRMHVAEAMESGAFGLTTGFDGGPGDFASTDEVMALATVAGQYGGIYATHFRNFDNNYPSTAADDWGYGICHGIAPEDMPAAKYMGLMEALRIARETGVSTQISHIIPVYTIYQDSPPGLQEAAAEATLELLETARAEGGNIGFDMMPFPDMHDVLVSKVTLVGLFSDWVTRLGSVEAFVQKLGETAFRDELKREIRGSKFKFLMVHPRTDTYWQNRVVMMACGTDRYVGHSIGEIADERKESPYDVLFDIMRDDARSMVSCRDPRWTERSVRTFVRHPDAMVGADIVAVDVGGTGVSGGGGMSEGEPGIASYAAIPRYIRRFVREDRVLGLAEAVKKVTYLPAQKLGLKNRGVIARGAYADLVVFDYERIGDTGTWMNPSVAPAGIEKVVVNGLVAYDGMKHLGVKSGRVLRRND